jgi:uncharacterized protein YuzE
MKVTIDPEADALYMRLLRKEDQGYRGSETRHYP